MLLECLAATAVFALTCGAVLWFMRMHDPPSPRWPLQPPRAQLPLGKDDSAAAKSTTERC
jgi:hypothetical protein